MVARSQRSLVRLSCGGCDERNHEIFADHHMNPNMIEIRCTKCSSVTVVTLSARLHLDMTEGSLGGLAPLRDTTDADSELAAKAREIVSDLSPSEAACIRLLISSDGAAIRQYGQRGAESMARLRELGVVERALPRLTRLGCECLRSLNEKP